MSIIEICYARGDFPDFYYQAGPTPSTSYDPWGRSKVIMYGTVCLASQNQHQPKDNKETTFITMTNEDTTQPTKRTWTSGSVIVSVVLMAGTAIALTTASWIKFKPDDEVESLEQVPDVPAYY